ncbi:Retrovirus-related Pol polyprotein from transposon opus, partial [Mucuna pruriens]
MDMRRNVSALIKNEQVSALIQPSMLKKCRDLGTFIVPCTIGKCTFANAMLDLGASINVMSSSIYRSLKFGDLEPIGIIIQLANKTIAHPLDILEDVMVQVNELIFPADFYVLDMEDEPSSKGSTLILGRPFLMTTRTEIDVHDETLSMKFGDSIVQFNIFEAIKHPIQNHYVFRLDVIDVLVNDYMQLCSGLSSFSEFSDFANFVDFGNLVGFECTCDGGPELAEVLASPSPLPSIMKPLALELKSLPKHLKKLNQATRKDHFTLPFIDQVLERLAESCMEVFMDDFTVYDPSFDACLESLSRVLDRCIKSNLVLNFEKCHFIVTKGIVLGHLVSNKDIEVDKAKIDIISSISHPIYVQEALDWELPFELMYDASNLALETVLDQQVGKNSTL